MRKLLTVIPLALLIGCGTLAPDGPYGGDMALYQADTTIALSYDLMHSFVTWEYQNREAFKQWPEIKKAADNVRANAKGWISSAIALREAYSTKPTPDSRDKLQKATAVLRQAMTEATKYMNQYGGNI